MSALSPIRASFAKMLAQRDYALKDVHAPLRGYDGFLALAKAAGFTPRTIIDVGVAHGTPWLHDAFPDAHLVLVEPQSQFATGIAEMVAARRSAEWQQVAIGDAPGEAVLNIMTDEPGSSSLHAMSDEHAGSYEARGIDTAMHQEVVRVVRLDSIDTSAWPTPWLLKIDAEGHEMAALRGAAGILPNVSMVIAELSMNNAYAGPSFAQTLMAFEEAGFPLYEIIEMQARGRTGRVTMVDGVFLPTGHSILND